MPDVKPNIVMIMTDQQRADLCRREGYPLDTTPFLDELATCDAVAGQQVGNVGIKIRRGSH